MFYDYELFAMIGKLITNCMDSINKVKQIKFKHSQDVKIDIKKAKNKTT